MSNGQNVYVVAEFKDFAVFPIDGPCPLDLYVFVHSEDRYLQFVTRGEKLTAHKVETIKKLSGSNLFMKSDENSAQLEKGREKFLAMAKDNLASLEPKEIYEGENLGTKSEHVLKSIFSELLSPTSGIPPQEMSNTLSMMSEDLLKVLVPEVGDVKVNLLKHLSNVTYMNNSAAMSTFAILIAMSNDFKSKTTFRHLSIACLVMDSGMADLEDHWIETYYRNRAELPSHIWDRIKNHPVKSQQMVAYLPLSSDLLNQLILTHHELHNGQGYHRGIQSGSVLTMGRILALAVDLFEVNKGHELRGTPVTLKELFFAMREGHVDVHARRHQLRLVENLLDYLGLKNQKKKAA
jgi:HD-GYP domain-containing protein (c-di-GMP phosphodiesterase class II)